MILGDSRQVISGLDDNSVHLVVTSPPYWNLKKYEDDPGQMGHINDYEQFLIELGLVWEQVLRVLTPGGRLVVVVGDVVVARKNPSFKRHLLFPLHADIQVQCRKMGFDNLNPIIWYKISNAKTEMSRPSKFLGKPYEPNGIIKNEAEYILMLRKPGDYRRPTPAQRQMSRIPKKEFQEWFRQVWEIPGASTKNHPAPFPLNLADRLVRMFSFVGDVVLDPFLGSGTTSIAAALADRSSIGIEVIPRYLRIAQQRFGKAMPHVHLQVEGSDSQALNGDLAHAQSRTSDQRSLWLSNTSS